jgi:hypothetical protein
MNMASYGSASFIAAVKTNVDANWSAALNTIENANSTHYNGHPASSLVKHFVVVAGYDSGNRIKFDDPAASSTAVGWTSAANKFDYSGASFWANFMNYSDRGLVW